MTLTLAAEFSSNVLVQRARYWLIGFRVGGCTHFQLCWDGGVWPTLGLWWARRCFREARVHTCLLSLTCCCAMWCC